jgi:hypothetical protein
MTWDFTRDWNLFDKASPNILLRPKLGFKYPTLYYIAIGINAFLRFGWILTLSPDVIYQTVRPELFTLILGLCEAYRRC